MSNNQLIKYIKAFFKLSEIDSLSSSLSKNVDFLEKKLEALQVSMNTHEESLKKQHQQTEKWIKTALQNLSKQLLDNIKMTEEKYQETQENVQSAIHTLQMQIDDLSPSALNIDLNSFYTFLADRFRGPENLVESRLEVYLPNFKALSSEMKELLIIDIGCGRGELLNLLQKENLRAIGIDLNTQSVEYCRQRNFQAIAADALSYLEQQADNSIAAITAIHIIEHITFPTLLSWLQQMYRVLVPGGFIILETPNPENLQVSATNFYKDPSHHHPLPPDLLALTVEFSKFSEIEILRLQPKKDNIDFSQYADDNIRELLYCFYLAQDYAIIAKKY